MHGPTRTVLQVRPCPCRSGISLEENFRLLCDLYHRPLYHFFSTLKSRIRLGLRTMRTLLS